MTLRVYPITSRPGIKRDGTILEGNYYVDGQWCRFQRGIPKKMGGYKTICTNFNGPVYGLYVYPRGDYVDIYGGSANTLEYVEVDFDGGDSSALSRVPSGLINSPNNLWQFDSMYDESDETQSIICHAGQNLSDIDNIIETPVFYGSDDPTTPLVPIVDSEIGAIMTSGGIIVLQPYLFVYGSNGLVMWSDLGSPGVFHGGDSGNQRISPNKVVKGLQTRGGTNSPAGLFWTLDSLIRATFVGGPTIFNFDTITDQTSILSSQSVIEYDGVYFWCAIDRFLMYNGVVREVPNQLNLNFFFDNLNYDQRQKIWATKIPRYGEIWWFFPFGNATECNHAVIYNIRENTWYDTAINRSAGYFSQTFQYPTWADNVPNNQGDYNMWIHEYENDQLINGQALAIQSYFETSDVSFPARGPTGEFMGIDKQARIERIEPDFLQTGNMTVTVTGSNFARGESVDSVPYPFDPETPKIDMREQRREMRLRFESNDINGHYEMGLPLLHVDTGDTRP